MREKHNFPNGIKPKEYNVWKSMKARCLAKNKRHYPSYYGKDISVCDRWVNSYETFISDMGLRPSDEHSIDRIDNSGPYCPENCRWATRSEQTKNRDCVIRYDWDGKKFTALELANAIGMPYDILYQRLRAGWPKERWTEPSREWNNSIKKKIFSDLYLFKGKMKNLTLISKETGIPLQTLHWRIKNQWPLSDLYKQPRKSRWG